MGISVIIGRFLNEHFGMMVMIDAAKNMQDAESIRQALSQKYPGYTVTVETNKWSRFNAVAIGFTFQSGK